MLQNTETQGRDENRRYSLASAYGAWRASLVDTRTWAAELTADVDTGYSPSTVAAVMRDAVPADKT